jgi:hypothetical protein
MIYKVFQCPYVNYSTPNGFVQVQYRARIFKRLFEPKSRFQGMNSASLCCLAGRYDNTIPTRFLAPIDSLKISLCPSTQKEASDAVRSYLFLLVFLAAHK